MIKQLSSAAHAILSDALLVAYDTVEDFIADTTRTSGKPLSLNQLTERIMDDPENVDWVLTEGYYWRSDVVDEKSQTFKELFGYWKIRLNERIAKENAAIDRLNKIALNAALQFFETKKDK